MWISELAQEAGLPVATVKFYLREGLLPPGKLTGRTRARYTDEHLRRLRLIRTLIEVGGMRLGSVRAVLGALDDPGPTTHELLGAAHDPIAPAGDAATPTAVDTVDDLLLRLGWQVHPESAHRRVLARALDGCAAVDHPMDRPTLDAYASAALEVAEIDVAGIPPADPVRALEAVVIGTVLREPVLLALRRLAQQHASARRFATGGDTASTAD